jgi:glyoxylase-like metal-dependent hydrolase (beta-lactamase superfamily II)
VRRAVARDAGSARVAGAVRGLVLGGAVAVGIAATLAVWAAHRVGRLDVERVTPDLYVLSGVGGNVGALVTPGGVVVVDTMTFVRQGAALRARVRELTDRPVAAILNTHYHLDHTHGNPAFVPGTPVVATASTLRHLRERDAAFWRDPPARDLLPTDTFEGAHELRVGGKTVRSYSWGRGHTDGDLVVLFVEDRVLHAGDLYFNGHFPDVDLEAGGSVREWATTMERLLALDFDKVIPGHGPVSSREGFRAFQRFMASLWEQTRAVADRGGSLEDALETVDLERFALRRLWFAPQLSRAFVIRRAWEEAAAPSH